MSSISDTVWLDSTVLSNFASTDSVWLILKVCNTPEIPAEVAYELFDGLAEGHEHLENAIDVLDPLGILESLSDHTILDKAGFTQVIAEVRGEVNPSTPREELSITTRAAKRLTNERLNKDDRINKLILVGESPTSVGHFGDLDRGESAVLRCASEYGGIAASDDGAARDIAREYGIPLTGSLGILAMGVRQGEIDEETADAWLEVWEEHEYFAPQWLNSISDVLDRV